MRDPLSVLVLTNLFPNNTNPGFAPFNKQQFRELGRLANVEVLGIVPWRLNVLAERPKDGHPAQRGVRLNPKEVIDGLRVQHPRYLSIAGVPSLNAAFMTSALFPRVAWRRNHIDVILASYAYPDGCAGVALGRALRVPVVVKCHGSDLNRVPADFWGRMQLKHMLPRADRVVVVSKTLKEAAEKLGVDPDKQRIVYNGIDRTRFFSAPTQRAREMLNLPLDADIVVYVGLLAEHKGTRDLLAAVYQLAAIRPNVITIFVGDGPLLTEVAGHSEHRGARDGRVVAVGRVRHDEVPAWMTAADVLCLPSWDEGMPNVIREAHAIGRPVVATAVGGALEVIDRPELGVLVPPRDPASLARALDLALGRKGQATPDAISKLAVTPSWQQSAEELLSVLQDVVDERRQRIAQRRRRPFRFQFSRCP